MRIIRPERWQSVRMARRVVGSPAVMCWVGEVRLVTLRPPRVLIWGRFRDLDESLEVMVLELLLIRVAVSNVELKLEDLRFFV